MVESFELRELYPQRFPEDRLLLQTFLQSAELSYEEDMEYACSYVKPDGELAACGGCAGNILKCFAVQQELRGANLLGPLLSRLIGNRFQMGRHELFVFTKPEHKQLFAANGFYLLAETEQAVMMENSAGGVERYLRSLSLPAVEACDSAAVVMNCNPFTRGHLALVEHAALQCSLLHLFILEEDQSAFPFEVRFMLAKQGVAHMENVRVHPSGPYMISALTFPTYFLKENVDATCVQTELDLLLFAQRIAPPLGIQVRFIGEEPVCETTAGYHHMMHSILPQYGIRVEEIPRIRTRQENLISASGVRKGLAEKGPGNWLRDYVPDTTYDFLCSAQARPVLEKIRRIG